MSLITQDVAGGSTETLSTNMISFLLRDGLLAWIETTAASRALKVATTSAVSTLSILNSSVLHATDGGFVVYGESGKTYSWSPSTGPRLLLDTAPNKVIISGSTAYFVVGASAAVYRVGL